MTFFSTHRRSGKSSPGKTGEADSVGVDHQGATGVVLLTGRGRSVRRDSRVAAEAGEVEDGGEKRRRDGARQRDPTAAIKCDTRS